MGVNGNKNRRQLKPQTLWLVTRGQNTAIPSACPPATVQGHPVPRSLCCTPSQWHSPPLLYDNSPSMVNPRRSGVAKSTVIISHGHIISECVESNLVIYDNDVTLISNSRWQYRSPPIERTMTCPSHRCSCSANPSRKGGGGGEKNCNIWCHTLNLWHFYIAIAPWW